MYRNPEIIKISQNMIKHGGGFVKNIGQAIIHADLENRKKLEKAFPEYFKQYLNF